MSTARRAFSARAIDPVALPPWLTEADIDVFATEYQRTGFRGGLNWYRNIDRNWELTAPWHGAIDPAARAVHRRHARRGDHRLARHSARSMTSKAWCRTCAARS